LEPTQLCHIGLMFVVASLGVQYLCNLRTRLSSTTGETNSIVVHNITGSSWTQGLQL